MGSTGGIFTLLANEGRTDRLILATSLLQNRLQQIQVTRRNAGKQDCWPTLAEIERTHIIFMNPRYKPYVAMGCEYYKTPPYNGVPGFGTTVTFSIPQFGDFFHDMVCTAQFNSWHYGLERTPGQTRAGGITGGMAYNTATGEDDNDINWWNKRFPVNSNNGRYQYRLVNYLGEVIANGGNGTNLCPPGESHASQNLSEENHRMFTNLARWVEYPANRFFKKVTFSVNGNTLDEYNSDCNIMYEKFCVPHDKRIGYNRLCGQEVPHEGFSGVKRFEVLNSDSGRATVSTNWLNPTIWFETGINDTATISSMQSTASDRGFRNKMAPDFSGHVKFESVNGATSNGDPFHFGDPYLARYLHRIVDGPQTPKEVQPPLEIMHKLHFWFSNDVRLAIPSASIPFGQRYIIIETADCKDMIASSPALFVEKITTDMVTSFDSLSGNANDPPASAIAFSPDLDFLQQYNEIDIAASFEGIGIAKVKSEFYPYRHKIDPTALRVEKMDLYINNIFVNPEIHDIYIRRVGFTLIRVHRTANITINDVGQSDKLISQLKWPIEYMFVGIRPKWNISTDNPFMAEDWHRLTKCDRAHFPDEGVRLDLFSKTAGATRGQTTQIAKLERHEIQKTQFIYESHTVEQMKVSAHSIPLFNWMPNKFFSTYLPYHLGGANITTPADQGALLISFCLYPKTYQPSGYINVSRAREFHVHWESGYVSSARASELIIVASAINFLLISDGSACLRYST